MSVEKGKAYFAKYGLAVRVMVMNHSSATVELAAEALGCEPCRIAKTMSFLLGDRAILIVAAGDARVDNRKYKAQFQTKAKMIPRDEVEEWIGHAPGGVCPFATKEGVTVYLDESLKRFDLVYPAAGSSNSAIGLNLEELEQYSGAVGWIDVCRY
ncbi:MAG: YbaK/EbsC family protein [Lachnospiraceae bacterium]|nr:YbaK/EbsC family protein [Lachnospiraceae bacterium]